MNYFHLIIVQNLKPAPSTGVAEESKATHVVKKYFKMGTIQIMYVLLGFKQDSLQVGKSIQKVNFMGPILFACPEVCTTEKCERSDVKGGNCRLRRVQS